MEDIKILSTIEEIKAVSDPYRMKIIKYFKDENRALTVKELADSLGEVPAKVHYHVKKLEKVGILHLTRTGEINGIITKYYELTAKVFEIKSEEASPDIKGIFLDETKKLINSIYEESKSIVFKQLDEDREEDFPQTIRLNSVYLTEKEFKEFKEYVDRFCKNHISKNRNASDKLEEYHFFSTIFKVKGDKDDK
ncbi:ArsR family transcriptional regulator [Clostridium malenominatum]|uniref:ArsR family transcriptional regulator n=1 Tax=Clostridium malenominatum TaxID=1539 RepID=A0ABN1J826_9CLOT